MRNRIPSAARVARRHASYSGNPDGKPIYEVEIDHGYENAISGGSDVMQGLVNDLRREQGTPPMRLAGEDHPCQRGLPCECGGSCGCGGQSLRTQPDYGDRVARSMKVAGKIEIEEGDELIALKDVNVGFPAGIGRDRSGVVRRSSRVRVDYTTRRGDVFCQLIQGQVLLRELDGKTLTRIERTSWSREPFALRDGHRSRHPYDSGVVESRVWKVLKRKK